MGSCVDNSRIYDLLAALAGKLGVEVSQLPVAGSAPEFITEKAISIAPSSWPPDPGPRGARAEGLREPLRRFAPDGELPGLNGGKVLVAATPDAAVSGILAHLREKRQALGLPQA